jgi:CheY-like chemotaxis protein
VPTVLLVDDDPVILRLLEVNFRLDGFETMSATRGEEALEQAAEAPPDAVVLDVMMPGMDGYEVCRRLRDLPGLADVPVVFLTARAEDADRGAGGATGDVQHVTKPFDPSILIEAVRARISGGST